MFTNIPEWTYEGADPSIHTFFSAIALAGLEGKEIRLSADTQRKLLGHPVFGKREIVVKDFMVTSTIKIAFGVDWETSEYTAAKIKSAVDAKKSLRPGYTGAKYA